MHAQQSMAVKQQVYQALDDLPMGGLEELVQFIEYLQHKYKNKRKRIISLKGLWADVPFDVTDDDVRALRRHVGAQLAYKVAE